MFVSFEGMEGSGKSTVMGRMAEYMEKCGRPPLLTREPGGSALGRKLRSILLDTRNAISPSAEFYLFMADRAQHVEDVIRPALEEGQTVLCDRYVDSTYAYQGYGRGGDLPSLRLANTLATGGLLPDLTFLLDLPVSTGLARAGRRNQEEGTVISEGRFDSESINFHERVRNGYLALAKDEPGRFAVIDAAAPLEEVVQACIKTFEARRH